MSWKWISHYISSKGIYLNDKPPLVSEKKNQLDKVKTGSYANIHLES